MVTVVRDGTVKSTDGLRYLPLSDIMLRRFQDIRQQQQRNRETLGDAYDLNYLDFVCVKQYGTLINPDYVTQAFSKHLKKCGLRHIRYHDLRHGCASILFDLGYSVKAVQTWMGHSNFNYTADVYIPTSRATHREMANQISMEIFTKAEGQFLQNKSNCTIRGKQTKVVRIYEFLLRTQIAYCA